MAGATLDAVMARIAGDPGFDLDQDLEGVLGRILVRAFGTGIDGLREPPLPGADPLDQVPELVEDPVELARITNVVRDIVGDMRSR
jgi:hypothetical protein